MGYLIIFPIAILVGYWAWQFYQCADHKGWNSGANPQEDAEIVNIETDKFYRGKNDKTYRTTITFSDGFWYRSCDQERKDGLLTYSISMPDEILAGIRQKAIFAHNAAVEKKLKKKKS